MASLENNYRIFLCKPKLQQFESEQQCWLLKDTARLCVCPLPPSDVHLLLKMFTGMSECVLPNPPG